MHDVHTWEQNAEQYYSGHSKYKQALAAGIAMDNALEKDKAKFLTEQYLAWFDWEVLGRYGLQMRSLPEFQFEAMEKVTKKYGGGN